MYNNNLHRNKLQGLQPIRPIPGISPSKDEQADRITGEDAMMPGGYASDQPVMATSDAPLPRMRPLTKAPGWQMKDTGSPLLQMQVQGGATSCQQPTPGQIRAVINELDAGIARMNGYLQNPSQIVGPGQDAAILSNIRNHINATIVLAEQLKRDLSSGSLSLCILPAGCPNDADACFDPLREQFRLKPILLNPVSRGGVAAVLHEYKHFQQHRAYANQVMQSNVALIHASIDELSYEYEAALVDSIYFGNQLTSGRTPLGSTMEMYEVAAPREVLTFASQHPPGARPTSRSQLPTLNRAYTDQISRNSPVIHYPVESSNGRLRLRNRAGDTIELGTFTEAEIGAKIPVERAFWSSTEASTYEQGNYRRGVLVVYVSSNIVAQISITRRPRPALSTVEVSPVEEREISPTHP